jgi:hypothetical protein
VPCRGTERLLDHDTSLPTDSDDGQCLCEQRQHTPVTSGDTTLSECRSLASLPKRCCRPSPSLPHNQSIPSPQPIHPIPTTQSSPRDLRKRHRSRPRRVSAPSPAECRFRAPPQSPRTPLVEPLSARALSMRLVNEFGVTLGRSAKQCMYHGITLASQT